MNENEWKDLKWTALCMRSFCLPYRNVGRTRPLYLSYLALTPVGYGDVLRMHGRRFHFRFRFEINVIYKFTYVNLCSIIVHIIHDKQRVPVFAYDMKT